MPLYDFECDRSSTRLERFLPLARYQEPQFCACGSSTTRVIVAPMIRSDYPDYNCPVTGKLISGAAAHRENLARTGSRVLEPGEKEAAAKFRATSDASVDAVIDSTIEKAYEEMPGSKREVLANELAAGLTPVVERLSA
jgi:hypothetical protein